MCQVNLAATDNTSLQPDAKKMTGTGNCMWEMSTMVVVC